MPKIPDGAKQPKDHQSGLIKPELEKHADGWELLRPPIDLEFWEITEFTALVAGIKTRGARIELDAANMRVVGEIVKQMQTVFANDSVAFRSWLKDLGGLDEQASALLPLIYQYASALGEALSSGK